jgi:hypothetical protein
MVEISSTHMKCLKEEEKEKEEEEEEEDDGGKNEPREIFLSTLEGIDTEEIPHED